MNYRSNHQQHIQTRATVSTRTYFIPHAQPAHPQNPVGFPFCWTQLQICGLHLTEKPTYMTRQYPSFPQILYIHHQQASARAVAEIDVCFMTQDVGRLKQEAVRCDAHEPFGYRTLPYPENSCGWSRQQQHQENRMRYITQSAPTVVLRASQYTHPSSLRHALCLIPTAKGNSSALTEITLERAKPTPTSAFFLVQQRAIVTWLRTF